MILNLYKTMNHFDIQNLSVLITGSTQGIGFGLARGFVQAGAKVYLNGRNLEKLEKAIQQLDSEGMKAHASCFDVKATKCNGELKKSFPNLVDWTY